jgi:hypothetical protein
LHGLAKGSRVLVPDGKKPIEAIRVGDYVLSCSEIDSVKPEFKRVVKTVMHEAQTIFDISIAPENWSFPDPLHLLVATGDHPFWVEGNGWTSAYKLKPGQRLRQGDGKFALISGVTPVYRTGKDGIGWHPSTKSMDSRGTVFNYANNALASEEDEKQFVFLPQEVLNSGDPFLRVPVYNFEVEDFHTYYVGGKLGYLTHDSRFEP